MTEAEEVRSILDGRGIKYEEIQTGESGATFLIDYCERCDDYLKRISVHSTYIEAERRYANPEQAVDVVVGPQITENTSDGDREGLLNECLYTFRLFLSRPDLLNEETVQAAHDELVRKMTNLGVQVHRAAKMADPEGHVRGRAYEVLLMVNRCSKMELTDYILKLEENRDGYVEELRKNEQLKADNEKLRELVHTIWLAGDFRAFLGVGELEGRMVKLGIEVSDE